MPFTAIMNTPGYLPWHDGDSPRFTTASEAWTHLADERKRAEDDCEVYSYSATVNLLERVAEGTMDAYGDAGLEPDGTGTIYGSSPGHNEDDPFDLGVAYTVVLAEHDYAAALDGAIGQLPETGWDAEAEALTALYHWIVAQGEDFSTTGGVRWTEAGAR